MTSREMQTKVQDILELASPELKDKGKLESDVIFYFLNLAVEEFIKTRLDSSFELNQTISDDLRDLVRSKLWNSTKDGWSENPAVGVYTIDLNTVDEYWSLLGEEVKIKDLDGNNMLAVDSIECTVENITSSLNNKLSQHIYRRKSARPLKYKLGNTVYLYTDKNYNISSYRATYIKRPEKIEIGLIAAHVEYTGMPVHTHNDIVVNAARLILASILSTKSSDDSKK